MKKTLKIICTGLLAGFVSEATLGLLFTSSPVRSILYNPQLQSQLFIEVTTNRSISLSVTIAGLVILSIIHAWLYSIFIKSIPGNTWVRKGLFWGLTIWLMYWVFQEWFIFRTLLGEPVFLTLLELTLLIVGSVAEGLIIAFIFRKEFSAKEKNDKIKL